MFSFEFNYNVYKDGLEMFFNSRKSPINLLIPIQLCLFGCFSPTVHEITYISYSVVRILNGQHIINEVEAYL